MRFHNPTAILDRVLYSLLFCILLWATPVSAAQDVLARVKANGFVRCATYQIPGFSDFDNKGQPRGFDIDFCRAVAAAVLGDADAIVSERVGFTHKFKALVDGNVDIAFGMSTWTYSRDTELLTRFVAPIFFDGQGFMAWTTTPQAKGLIKGSTVCVQTDTTTVANLREYNARHKLNLNIIETKSSDDRLIRFVRRDCDLLTGDSTELAVQRVSATLDPNQWVLLDQIISREPLGPYVVAEDNDWFAIVRWVINVTQIAEERGINQNNLANIGADTDGELRRLAGLESGFGAPLGLDDLWARRVIEQVGNYGEIFERNLGNATAFKFKRGHNQPVSSGGLFFPPPLR